ncbi:hypothetical protein [Actinomycetospora lemnae]|uniref:Lipoprotein n=1 Tax=Actinomycetospora lemnae TaxID=3019891 RepID=A0ABT5SML9_9PSEU|nr:hypothetical protein [Actinomycetospora sp. DW7H6]MDD7964072.1 hypothetical protein [Actinomycetospora sp. DW7H6]
MRRALAAWERFYGADPLHLLALVGCFALVAAVVRQVADDPSWWWMLVWFVGAIVAHDLVSYPLYALADRSLVLGRWAWRRRTGATAPRVGVVDHLRLPAMGSLLLLVVFWPSISRAGEPVLLFAAGRTTEDYLDRWLWVTAGLFLLSAVVYAVRLGRAAGTGRP